MHHNLYQVLSSTEHLTASIFPTLVKLLIKLKTSEVIQNEEILKIQEKNSENLLGNMFTQQEFDDCTQADGEIKVSTFLEKVLWLIFYSYRFSLSQACLW
jgi:hypothetical protein